MSGLTLIKLLELVNQLSVRNGIKSISYASLCNYGLDSSYGVFTLRAHARTGLMRFIVGENGPSKRPRLALCASLGWFADF